MKKMNLLSLVENLPEESNLGLQLSQEESEKILSSSAQHQVQLLIEKMNRLKKEKDGIQEKIRNLQEHSDKITEKLKSLENSLHFQLKVKKPKEKKSSKETKES